MMVNANWIVTVLNDASRKQKIAIDSTTRKFPSSLVNDQNEMTLKQLVDGMIADIVALPPKKDSSQVGLLRVQHVIHENGREATLTVFPVLCILSSTNDVCHSESANGTINWVSGEDLSDNLERRLAKAAFAEQIGESTCSLNLLKDDEGPQSTITG